MRSVIRNLKQNSVAFEIIETVISEGEFTPKAGKVFYTLVDDGGLKWVVVLDAEGCVIDVVV
ncbi:hypothetical protein Mag101_06670 [Microbulbifer agarilyticus]|uniref:Uncharacterized protein n=1 Tax=Microbulbifer agarilyticus TaxID=260552 RepID=A0A1Q2M548_9GAMM|nr:hypothetical protein Mag101_06670 [Microbulbifer agarilyticus]